MAPRRNKDSPGASWGRPPRTSAAGSSPPPHPAGEHEALEELHAQARVDALRADRAARPRELAPEAAVGRVDDLRALAPALVPRVDREAVGLGDRKSTRLNSSH